MRRMIRIEWIQITYFGMVPRHELTRKREFRVGLDTQKRIGRVLEEHAPSPRPHDFTLEAFSHQVVGAVKRLAVHQDTRVGVRGPDTQPHMVCRSPLSSVFDSSIFTRVVSGTTKPAHGVSFPVVVLEGALLLLLLLGTLPATARRFGFRAPPPPPPPPYFSNLHTPPSQSCQC
jgi:hypothetical protein